jgi:putative NADH-flavin reductase
LNIRAAARTVKAMHITVFGAAGPTGTLFTERALAAGHDVTAAVRRPLPDRTGVRVVHADATDADAVSAAVEGADAVVSILGTRLSRRPVSLYSEGAAAILAAMDRHGVRRLLAVSSSVLDPAWRPTGATFFNAVLDPYVNRVLGRTVHDDMRRMEALVRASDVDWTLVRASGLFDTDEVTDHLVSPGSADGVYTARVDLAAAMLDELTGRRFVRAAMGVATTSVTPSVLGLVRREILAKR